MKDTIHVQLCTVLHPSLSIFHLNGRVLGQTYPCKDNDEALMYGFRKYLNPPQGRSVEVSKSSGSMKLHVN